MVVSFSGSVSAMINSLKNNARKRKTIYDKGDLLDRPYNRKIILPKNKMSDTDLEKLLNDLRKEQKNQAIRTGVATLVILLPTVFLVYYLLF